MNQLRSCPSASDLSRLTDAELPVEQLETILEHVEQCGDCTKVVRDLEESHAFQEPSLQRDNQRSNEDEFQLSKLIDLLKRVGPASEASAVTNSLSISDTLIVKPNHRNGDTTSAGQYPFLAKPEAANELGRLGHYIVLRLLGSGGMGLVFEAEDTILRRRVALKVMQPSQAADQEAKRRFLAEARATAAIEHEHIAVIYQVGEESGVPYLAMQLLQGETLADRLSKTPQLSECEALRIAKETAEGLAAAHACGLIHRDIKPANIWLEAKGDRVKVVDFGLVRDMSLDTQLTQSGAIAGTPAYMSPEQVNSQPLDGRTDLFSLGCVLYQMISGKNAFSRDSLFRVLHAVCNEAAPALHTLRPDIGSDLASLINRLIAKDRELRPASAREVADEVGRMLAKFPAQTTSPAEPLLPQSGGLHGRKRGQLFLAGWAVGFALLFLTIWVIIRDKDGKELARISAPDGSTAIVEGNLSAIPAAPVKAPINSGSETSPHSPLPSFANDEEILRHFSRTGAKIQINGSSGYAFQDELRGKVTDCSIDYIGSAYKLTNTDLEALSNITFPLRLTLAKSTELRQETIDKISQIKTLTHLYLPYAITMKETSFSKLAALSKLKHLSLPNTNATDEIVRQLPTWESLESLLLGDSILIRGETLEMLEKYPKLRDLNLIGTQVSRLPSGICKKLPNLEIIELAGTDANDDTMRELAEAKKLLYVNIASTKVTTEGLTALLPLRYSLENLNVRDISIDDTAAATIAQFRRLKQLNLSKVRLTEVGLAELLKLNALTHLGLSGTPMNDKCVGVLGQMKQLKSLHLHSTHITQAGIDRLKEALPDCQISGWQPPLDLNKYSESTDQSLLEWMLWWEDECFIQTLDGKEFTIRRTDRRPALNAPIIGISLEDTVITDDDLGPVQGCRELKTIAIGDTRLTDDGIARLKALPKLEKLSLGIVLTDRGAEELTKFPKLNQLSLRRPKISEKGIATIASMPLKSLSLSRCAINNEGIEKLADISTLDELTLSRCQLTDDMLVSFEKVLQLKTLNLQSNALTKHGIEKLRLALPNCKVVWDGP
jgi:tRNA A-37 threonylcarbamoyl transferase component Bud32/Leucine-rich repeat (LRR) protein